jgi:hypothetical protein
VGRDDESCYETSFTALVILYSTMSITHILYTDASSLAAVFFFSLFLNAVVQYLKTKRKE